MAERAVRGYKKRENPVYDNKSTNNSSQNPTYLEFHQIDQIYSFATETSWHNTSSDGSNGTVSTYTEGRVRTQRSGDTVDLHSRNRNCPNMVSPSALGDSIISTGTTYDQIAETSFTNISVDVSAETTNEQLDKTTSISLVKKIVILTVLIALSIGAIVLIYMFVIITCPNCNSVPEVINGEIANSKSNEESATVTVLCKKGYQMEGNETMACEKGVWTAQPKCVPIKCGEFPNVDNGTVNGTGFEFNSTAEVVCDPGFIPEGSATITCQADGNWSSTPNCVQHPCGVFTPAVDLLPVRESNSSYLTLCFKCKPGLTYTNGSEHCVTCHQGEWEGHTECEVSGPDCNSIPEVINGEITNSKSNQESVTVTVLCKKGYHMEGNETIACEKGEWTAQPKCIPIKCGEFPNVDNGTVNGTGFEFNATAEVVCDPGFIPEESDTITCQADGNWSSTPNCVQHPCGVFTPAVDLLPVRESNSSYLTLCFKCKPGLTYTNRSDQCVTCHQGEWKGHTECEVSGVINFQPHQLTYSANDMMNLTCALRDSPNWHSVGLARTDSEGSNVEALYNILNTNGEIKARQLSSISTYNVEYYLVTNGVNLVFKIDNIKCEDSGIYICANIVGDIVSPDKVKSTNTSVTVKAQPGAPEWKHVPDDIISGTSTLFKCSGEIGDPKGYIDVESNLGTTWDGNYSLLLTTKLTQDSNEVGFINHFTDEKTKCGYRRTVAFQLRNTTSKYHQKGLRCVSRPPDSLAKGQAEVSDTRLIEVIPDDYCGITDTILPHPYHCDRFVICGNGKVAGVPAGCGDNCFNIHDNTCYPCEQLGGCSITDIYIDGYNGWIQEGHSTSMICKVRDFEGLTDIVITKDDNSTVISKVSEEDIDVETGVTYVSEHSYINGTFGQLTIRFDSVKCQHKGTYQCFPVGSGKSSNDETTLALRDSNGNLIC